MGMSVLLTIMVVCLLLQWIAKALASTPAEPESGDASITGRRVPEPERRPIPPVERKKPRFASASTCFEAEYVSYSRLRTYVRCPHSFRLQYMDKVNLETNPFVIPGKVFHTFCEAAIAKSIGGPLQPLKVSDVDASTADAQRYEFVRTRINPRSKVMAVEHRMRFALRGIKFEGIVDLILEDPDGVTHLVDYKTGRAPKLHLEQLEIYSLPFIVGELDRTVRLTYICVDTKEPPITWEVGPSNREEIIARIMRLTGHIMEDAVFPARVMSHCENCGCRSSCAPSKSGARRVDITWPKLTPARAALRRRRRAKDAQAGGLD